MSVKRSSNVDIDGQHCMQAPSGTDRQTRQADALRQNLKRRKMLKTITESADSTVDNRVSEPGESTIKKEADTRAQ